MFKEENFGEIDVHQEAIKSENERLRKRAKIQGDLAEELYKYMFGEAESHNAIMDYWVDDANPDGFAAKFAQLENDPIFLNHPQLKGDLSNLTVNAMLQYKEDGTLPLDIEEESLYRK